MDIEVTAIFCAAETNKRKRDLFTLCRLFYCCEVSVWDSQTLSTFFFVSFVRGAGKNGGRHGIEAKFHILEIFRLAAGRMAFSN